MIYKFSIADLDCSEEVRALKRELVPLVGEDNLDFNTLSRVLTVKTDNPDFDRDSIIKAVAKTGMKAQALGGQARPQLQMQTCSCCGDAHPDEQIDNEPQTSAMPKAKKPRFDRRSMFCAASGVLIVLALILGAFGLDWANKACLLAASILGLYMVAPKAWYSLRHLAPDMNLLMVVAVTGALLLGDWLEGAAVAFLFALSNLLEAWSTDKARKSIEKLLNISPRTALLVDADGQNSREVLVENVPVGARIMVRPGDSIPLDGEVLSGNSYVNQAPITGESNPVEKQPGEELYAGTINGDGALIMRSTKLSEDSTLARILQMVEEAQSKKARVMQWVEKFAAVYTPVMMAAALLVAVLPPLFLGGDWSHWVYQALVLLVIACPCALVISTPVSITAALATAARNGVLLKGGVYLELPAKLEVLALDKTGTLTSGEFALNKVLPADGQDADQVLALAAALEAFSSHPLARAVSLGAKQRNLSIPQVEQAQAVPGKGAKGLVSLESGQAWLSIGSRRYLDQELGPEVARQADAMTSGSTANTIFLWNDSRLLGALLTGDTIRPESVAALAELQELGVSEIVMLTGDSRGNAEAVARQTGVTRVEAELLPEDKAAIIADLVGQGKVVGMAGDGINDAPALATASLSIAMGSGGTDVAIETADVALMSDDLGKIPWLVRLSRKTMRIIRQNITFALGLKLFFAILTLLGFAAMWMAVIADVGATMLVIANGLRLLRAPKQKTERQSARNKLRTVTAG